MFVGLGDLRFQVGLGIQKWTTKPAAISDNLIRFKRWFLAVKRMVAASKTSGNVQLYDLTSILATVTIVRMQHKPNI